MTALVDEAVFDYFSLLLNEVEDEADIQVETISADISEAVVLELISEGSSVEALRSGFLNQEPATPDFLKQDHLKPEPLKNVLSGRAGAVDESKFENPGVIEAPELKTQLKTQSYHQTQTEKQAPTQSKIRSRAPHLDKLALEQLLEPVFKPEPQIVTETIVKLQNQTVAEFEMKTASTPNKITVKPKVDGKLDIKADIKPEQQQDLELKTQLGEIPPKVTKDLLETLDDEFQVLFFKVAGLTLAVPLVSLGGIVKIERINHIMGRPAWYKGVQTYRDTQLNIVDTGAWVMPEKYDKSLAESVNYQYVVILEDSNWGLACESLVNAVKITKSEVNWRSKAGKRPWLAGVVKEQMCGILHVQALIELLNSGLGSQDPVG